MEVVPRQIWFRSTPEFDGYLSRTYTGVHERAAAGALDHFKDTPEDCLSLIIVLDQFPRNIYRGTARAYASDAKAREIANTRWRGAMSGISTQGHGFSSTCPSSTARSWPTRNGVWSCTVR